MNQWSGAFSRPATSVQNSPWKIPSLEDSGLSSTPSYCSVCWRTKCNLRTHASYLQDMKHSPRQPNTSLLLKSSFISSYSFNPLTVAIDYVCGQLQIDLDPSELSGHSSLPSAMNKLISYDIASNTPFKDPESGTLPEVASDWLLAAAVDELACMSTLNLWLLIESTNSRRASLDRYASKVTTSFLEQLRKKIESKEAITSGTIFAASNHLAVCLIFLEQSKIQREIMMNGLEALVNAR